MIASVLVVNHNRKELLSDCLASIRRQTFKDFEIVVIDNGSRDGSIEVVRTLTELDRRVTLVSLEQNQGFAGGCNAGLAAAQGRFIALLNNDAVAGEGWLEALVAAAEEDPAIGMCASKIVFFGSNVIDKTGHQMYFDGQNRGRGTGEVDRGQYDHQLDTFFPDGCAALYRRRMLDEIGFFDPEFFAYGDDADLGVRARLRGWKCRFVPEAVVQHHHSSTLGRFSPEKVYWVERNRLWLTVKNFPLPLLLLTPLFTLYRWSWNLAAALAGRGPAGAYSKMHSKRSLAGALLRGYRDGLRGVGKRMAARREVRQGRTLSNLEFLRLLWRFRISAARMAQQEWVRE